MNCARNFVRALTILGLTCLTPAVHACAVCFGQTDSPLGKGLHWGVLALLGCIGVMLVAFGAFAVFLARRSVAMERAAREEGTEDAELFPDAPR